MKNIIWVIAVLLLAFAGDRIGGLVLKKITDQSQFRYSRLYNGQAGCDVLLAGNSRGLIYYQPYIEEKTGYTTTNLSYNGMPMELAAPIIKDHIDKNGAPKLLLLDISLIDKRMDASLTAAFNFYTPYSERLSALMRDSFPNDFYGGKVTHLYRYNSEVFQRALYYLKKSDKDWLLDRVISPTLQKNVVKINSFNYDFNEKMLDDLKDMVSYAQKNNVKVKLLLNPYFPPFAKKIFNKTELINAVQKATGLKVYDYANSIQGVDGFGDYQHLNKNGARAFIDLLVEDGILEIDK
ncbi:MAG TPA: hypothetical protein ENJ95_22670 [Bacteroidetes bacterium]|nr:hypothetical protein [Bacteroidota bacterium]